VLSVLVVLDELLDEVQDMEMKKYGENDEYMSHKVSYKWIRKTQVIPEYVVFYNVWGF